MQTTNEDIKAMVESISEIFGSVSVSVDYSHPYYVYKDIGVKSERKPIWRVCVHCPTIILLEFKSWSELCAWARSQDKDFSEQILIKED